MTNSAKQKMDELALENDDVYDSIKKGFEAGYATRSEEVAETLKAVREALEKAVEPIEWWMEEHPNNGAFVGILKALALLDSLDKGE